MNTIQIFEQRKEMEKEKEKLNKKIESINLKIIELTRICTHELVFKYNDNHPRKKIIYGHIYCPACGKNIEIFSKNQNQEFDNSKIIDLTNISLINDIETLKKIKEEVLNNYDFYYKCKDNNELRSKMENVLEKYKYDYNKRLKIFKQNI